MKSKFGYGKPIGRRSSSKVGSSKSNSEVWMYVGLVIVIIIVIAIACWCGSGSSDTDAPTSEPFKSKGIMDKIKDAFGNIGKKSELADLDVLYFFSPTCPWCQKMTTVLKNAGELGSVTQVDITKPDGQEKAKQYGAGGKGIPSFVSRKMKTGTVGFKKTTKEITDALKKARDAKPKQDAPKLDPNEAVGKVQDLQITLFASPQCGYCGKLKEDLEKAGLLHYMEIVDVSQPDGQALVKQLISDFRGVPICYSKKTQKHSVGYKPVDNIIMELS